MCTNLNSFELPETLERIGKDAFFHTGWMEAQTDDWKICDGVLLAYDGKETSIIIPGDIRLIASGFLSNYSKVKNVTLSYGLESVSPGAFAGCESLTQVNFSSSVRRIEAEAFLDCTMLKTLQGMTNVEEIGDSAFNGCKALTTDRKSVV